METWQLVLAAALGGAALLSTGTPTRREGSSSGPSGQAQTFVEMREELYGLPEPPLALAAEVYGIPEAEISAELDDISRRLAPAFLPRVTTDSWRYVRGILDRVSGSVARIYGPDNAYFPSPVPVGTAARAASVNVLNEIAFEVAKEDHLRYEMATSFRPPEIESLYTTGALEAEWIGYIHVIADFSRYAPRFSRWVEYLFLFPGSGERWPRISPVVTGVDERRKHIFVSDNAPVSQYGKNAGPWYLRASDPGAINATQLAMTLAGTAGEGEMAASAEGLEAGWQTAQGAARQVLVRKFTNALVALSMAGVEEGIPLLWDFECDPVVGECRG